MVPIKPLYISYNREERNLCSHLFRLLHENLDTPEKSPLKELLQLVSLKELSYSNLRSGPDEFVFKNVGIYSEVAIIRDAYFKEKRKVEPFMDQLTRFIREQENAKDCKLYSELVDKELNNPHKTHPKQIKQKAISKGVFFTEGEMLVYGSLQAMFNAKPDLLITMDNKMYVFEAKFTEAFDKEQLDRTWKIVQVWASLLYEDLGFTIPPEYALIKLGAEKKGADISWEEILLLAQRFYPEGDLSLSAFKCADSLLNVNIKPNF